MWFRFRFNFLMTPINTSTSTSYPPVVQSGAGSAIIINPCQVFGLLKIKIQLITDRDSTHCWKAFATLPKNLETSFPIFRLEKPQECYFWGDSLQNGLDCLSFNNFISLKYHRLHPEYIYQRIEKLGNMFTLRILLLICDIVSIHTLGLKVFRSILFS